MMFAFAFLVTFASRASGANFTFSNSFTDDDDVTVFRFMLATPGIVTMETVSFAAGGFDPVLTLFDSSGLILDQNDDGPSPSDSQLISNLGSGTYFLALSQFDNFPIGPFLSDGFTRSGQATFTGTACGVAGGTFYSVSTCDQRSPEWTVNLFDVDAAVVVPEPSALGLIMLAIVSGVMFSRIRNLSAGRGTSVPGRNAP